ncbi:hypothetical protein PLESTM_001666800 [Pleodorina starrii]|nr:hypothetical protein PLESTM_001666800 [Pleodorina starrii]
MNEARFLFFVCRMCHVHSVLLEKKMRSKAAAGIPKETGSTEGVGGAARGRARKALLDLSAVDLAVSEAWRAAEGANGEFSANSAMTVALLKRFMSGRQKLSNAVTAKRASLVRAVVAYLRKHDGGLPDRQSQEEA